MSFKDTNDHATVKHREQVFARLRAELMREAGNRSSFDRVKAHIQSNRDVQRDPELRAMIQAFILEREATFKVTHPVIREPIHGPRSFAARPAPAPQPVDEARKAAVQLEALEGQLHDHLTHFREAEARMVFDKIVMLQRHFPELPLGSRVEEYEHALTRMKERRARFDRHVEETAEKAVSAVQRGDHAAAARALKRLSSIHALHPDLLGEARFKEIREQIVETSEEEEHRDAARRLIEREQAVAGELKELAARIHEFHQIARTIPHRGPEFQKAEARYHETVAAVRSHDSEWLAGVIMDLVELLSEMSDPPPEKAQEQVDHFLASIRTAMEKLRRRTQPQ